MTSKKFPIYASLSDYLSATVKISICGNSIIEGGEDCEGVDLNGQTCESIGFGPGTLSCDIACTFDTYSCGPAPTATPTPIPTTTPTPTPTPVLTATPTPGDNSSDEDDSDTSTSETTESVSIPEPTVEPTSKPSLPSFLNSFDQDNNGILAIQELFSITKQWVDSWKKALTESIISGDDKTLAQRKDRECDLNSDYRCNLQDFSILMSYIK